MKGTRVFIKLIVWALLLEYLFLNYFYPRDFATAPFLPFEPFLPFVPAFDWIGPKREFGFLLQALYFLFSALVIFEFRFRTACFSLGAILITSLLGARNSYGNDVLYPALVLLIAGISTEEKASRNLQLQLAVVYFGAAVSKIFDPDWLTGAYIGAWMHFFRAGILSTVAQALPELWLAKILGWITIVIELVLAAWIVLRPSSRFLPLLGVGFHCLLSLFSGATFHMFFFVMTASFLLFLEPGPGTVVRRGVQPFLFIFIAAFVAASPNWRLTPQAYALTVLLLAGTLAASFRKNIYIDKPLR